MVEITEKEQFSVLGKGSTNEALKWIPPVWQEADSNFIEISKLAIHHHVQAESVCLIKESIHI